MRAKPTNAENNGEKSFSRFLKRQALYVFLGWVTLWTLFTVAEFFLSLVFGHFGIATLEQNVPWKSLIGSTNIAIIRIVIHAVVALISWPTGYLLNSDKLDKVIGPILILGWVYRNLKGLVWKIRNLNMIRKTATAGILTDLAATANYGCNFLILKEYATSDGIYCYGLITSTASLSTRPIHIPRRWITTNPNLIASDLVIDMVFGGILSPDVERASIETVRHGLSESCELNYDYEGPHHCQTAY